MGKKYYVLTLHGTSKENLNYVEKIYIESEGELRIRGQIHPPSASKSQLEEITQEDMEEFLKSQDGSYETSES